jgi:hypothetical protein
VTTNGVVLTVLSSGKQAKRTKCRSLEEEGFIHVQGCQGSWLRHCATNRNGAGSIPDGVLGFFH